MVRCNNHNTPKVQQIVDANNCNGAQYAVNGLKANNAAPTPHASAPSPSSRNHSHPNNAINSRVTHTNKVCATGGLGATAKHNAMGGYSGDTPAICEAGRPSCTCGFHSANSPRLQACSCSAISGR
jgi:hypothetical protein